MKYFSICLLFAIFTILCSLQTIYAEEEAPAAGGPAAKRIALRRPVGKAAVKAATTTTTTAAPAVADDEEGDYHDEVGENQYGDENEDSGSSTTTTTTEAPKKVGPVIRPFRSNDDFLNSLKRRQENAKKHRAEKPTPKPSKIADEPIESEDEESNPAPVSAPLPAKGFKGNSASSRRKLLKPSKLESPVKDAAAEESEQLEKEEAKPKRPIGGRLALRKRT